MQDSDEINVFSKVLDETDCDLFYYHRSSIIRGFNQCIKEMKEYGISSNLHFEDLDNHAELFELPQGDIVALKSFSCLEDAKTLLFSFYIACSTLDDDNGIRLSKIISYMYSRFSSNSKIKILNKEKESIGTMTVMNGVEVSPMSKSDNRMFQFIDVSVSTTLSFSLL